MQKFNFRHITACALVAAGMIATTAAPAQMTREILYQAFLTSPEGEPLTSDNVNLQLDFFDQEERGTLLHQVFMQGVDPSQSGGYVSIYVPMRSGKSMLDAEELNADLFLQVTLTDIANGTSSETLLPRQRFAPVVTALNADMIDGLDSSEFLTLEGSQTMKGSLTHLSPVAIRVRGEQPAGFEQKALIVESSLPETTSMFLSESSSAIVAWSGTENIPSGDSGAATVIIGADEGNALQASGDVVIDGNLELNGQISIAEPAIENPNDIVTKAYVDDAGSEMGERLAASEESTRELGSTVDELSTRTDESTKQIGELKTGLAKEIEKRDQLAADSKTKMDDFENKLSGIHEASTGFQAMSNANSEKIQPLSLKVDELLTSRMPGLESNLNNRFEKQVSALATEQKTLLQSETQKLSNEIEALKTRVQETTEAMKDLKPESDPGEIQKFATDLKAVQTELKTLSSKIESANNDLTKHTVVAKTQIDSLEKKIETVQKEIETVSKNSAVPARTPAPVATQISGVSDEALTSLTIELDQKISNTRTILEKKYDPIMQKAEAFAAEKFVPKNGDGVMEGNRRVKGSLSVTSSNGGGDVSTSFKSQAENKNSKTNIGIVTTASGASGTNIGAIAASGISLEKVTELTGLADGNGLGMMVYNPAPLGTALLANASHPSGVAIRARGRVEIEGDLFLNGKNVGDQSSGGSIIVVPDDSDWDGLTLSQAFSRIQETREPTHLFLMPGNYEWNDEVSLMGQDIVIQGVSNLLVTIDLGELSEVVLEENTNLEISGMTITGSPLMRLNSSTTQLRITDCLFPDEDPLLIGANGFTTDAVRPSLNLSDTELKSGIRFSSDDDKKTVLRLEISDCEVTGSFEVENDETVALEMNFFNSTFWDESEPLELPGPEEGSVIRNTRADLSWYRAQPVATSTGNLMEEYIVFWRN